MSDSEPIGDLGRLIEVLARQAEASRRTADLLESRALPLLERIARALELTPATVATAPVADSRSRGIGEVRAAIGEARWDQAEASVRELSLAHPDDPEVAALGEFLVRARQFAVADLRERIEAARQANDPEGAIVSRDELAKILHGDPLQEIDRALIKWLMGLVQRRLRTGTVRPDVVGLAARVAESFGGTIEGASLRAALPTLRRSAGLCPRCGEPYAGIGAACPKCLAASAAPTPSLPPVEDDDPDDDLTSDPIDLNDDRLWKVP